MSKKAPARVTRKKLISTTKLPDSEPLTANDYWVITDRWKLAWSQEPQVPAKSNSLPALDVKIIDKPKPDDFQEFELPKDKYIHLNRDDEYQPELHELFTQPAEKACTYDLDTMDAAWLKVLNAERARAGKISVSDDKFERVIEELELRCCDKIQDIKSKEGLVNEMCDVCRSPYFNEDDEMISCDYCHIWVHQTCYGIKTVPSGSWLCRPCADGVLPSCVFCPNLGGAMKRTFSGRTWAHISCALWIPEASIGCPDKMEPISNITKLPKSRRGLVCLFCRKRKGACIQCSSKTCKTAYHVTCAFKYDLEMRAIGKHQKFDDTIKFKSYCQKHKSNSQEDKYPSSMSEEEYEVKKKRRRNMTYKEKSEARAARLQQINAEFFKHVTVKDIRAKIIKIDQDALVSIYNYWKLKRRSCNNQPLLLSKMLLFLHTNMNLQKEK